MEITAFTGFPVLHLRIFDVNDKKFGVSILTDVIPDVFVPGEEGIGAA